MYKYWYVADRQGIYYIGFCYGREDAAESELIGTMQEFCEAKDGELVLLVHISRLGLINQVFPGECTEESRMLLQKVINISV